MFVYMFGQNKQDAAADGHPVRLARVSARVFDGFLEGFGCFRFGSELQHDLAATNRNAVLVEGIKRLFALFAQVDEVRLPQDGEMVRDCRLGHIDLFDDFVD